MPGMGTRLETDNPTIVAAFNSALLRQGLVVLALLALLAIAWNVLRARALRRAMGPRPLEEAIAETPEPAGRRLLRIGFGCLWLFDGILQVQGSMPLGLASGAIAPAGASSPAWLRGVVGTGVTIWNDHPVAAAVAVVWIQVGVGLLMLVAPRGRWSRVAGLASVVWGLVVWIFGEALGGLLGGGVTWLFGAPGAALLYVVAGGLLVLAEPAWVTPRFSRLLLGGVGLFYLVMAVLQGWPGRGFWQGRMPNGAPGTLVAMVREMAATPQPAWLSHLVADFADFDAAHGFAVNLFTVLALGALGAAYCTGRRRPVTVAVIANSVICLADWLLIEDLGFLGGIGTDPNTMLPLVLIGWAGYLSLPPAISPLVERARAEPARRALVERPAYVLRSLAAVGALVVIFLGAVPMLIASLNPVADPILTEAIDGTPTPTDLPLLSFSLLDQKGRAVTPASLAGKAVALTFLDPVCTTDCPLIAQEMKEADRMLGRLADRAEFVAIVANPLYNSLAATRTFDAVEGLATLPNWLYLTGSVPALERLWNNYDVEVATPSGGAMVQHADIAYLIDPRGRVREILNSDPGEGSAPLESSFAGLVANGLRRLLA